MSTQTAGPGNEPAANTVFASRPAPRKPGFALQYPREALLQLLAMVWSALVWLGLIALTQGYLLMLLPVVALLMIFAQSAFIAHLRGNAVRVGPEQFPELDNRIAGCCRRLNLAKPPEVYLLHADGMFNALAARFLGREYVVLYSGVADALEAMPAALDFYIGHELGHHKLRHLLWAPFLLPASMLPLLGPALSRAHEYSCDRHGLAACENPGHAKIGLAALIAGHSRWKKLNLQTFVRQSDQTGGFWMSYHELVSGYPWLSKRAAAVQTLAEGHEPAAERRHWAAWPLALFTPHLPAMGGMGLLMIYVAMVGMLAAIAIPAFQDYSGRALIQGAVQAVAPLQQQIGSYAQARGELPSGRDLGFQARTLPLGEKGEIELQVEVSTDGEIELRFRGGQFKGETLVLVPTLTPAGLQWSCSAGTLPAKLRPPGCRNAAAAAGAAAAVLPLPDAAPAIQPKAVARPAPRDQLRPPQLPSLMLRVMAEAEAVKTRYGEFSTENGRRPRSMAELGLPYLMTVPLDAQLSGAAGGISLNGSVLSLTVSVSNGDKVYGVELYADGEGSALEWHCRNQNFPDADLPMACRG